MSKSPARAARARGLSLRTNLHLTVGRARLGHTQFTSLTYSWVLASKVWVLSNLLGLWTHLVDPDPAAGVFLDIPCPASLPLGSPPAGLYFPEKGPIAPRAFLLPTWTHPSKSLLSTVSQ